MSNAVEQLYFHFSESTCLDPETRAKLQALATARLAVTAELDQLCQENKKCRALLEVLDTLAAECEDLHARALFSAALEAGMALGRLQVN